MNIIGEVPFVGFRRVNSMIEKTIKIDRSKQACQAELLRALMSSSGEFKGHVLSRVKGYLYISGRGPPNLFSKMI